MTAAARDVPAAADGGLRLRRGARAGAVPARRWASRTCTCRRPSRRARGPRTATTSSTRRRSRTSSAARRSSSRWSTRCTRPAWGSCSTSSRTTWRRTTRTASGPTARCARSSSTSTRRPAATGASSTSTTSRRCARRTRRSSRRRTSWRCGSCARAHVDGLRIDHPDGLADPAGYLRRLRDEGVEHVWVEKILDPGEPLRDWPVDGTVGYEFLNDVCALFVDPAGEAPLTDLWVEVSGDDRRFADWAFEAKLEQARTTFAPEVERLAREAPERVTGLERALAVAARLPHLRRAVVRAGGRRGPRGRAARRTCRRRCAAKLLLETPGWDAFVTRFQQTTPPVMAKGVEDTAFYRYARLLALERRRRRSRALLAVGRRVPRGERRAVASASRATCWSPRRTTPSAPATCARGSARWRGWRTSSPRTCARGCRSAAR